MRRSLPTLVPLLVLAAALSACSRPGDPHAAPATAAQASAGADAARASASAAVAAQLAITRHVRVELAADRIAPLYHDVQAACAADAADGCVLLRAELDAGQAPSARLSLRAAPAGIAKLLGRLQGTGGIRGEGLAAEDLAAPIADGERRIAMLREYRDSLVALRARPGNGIDALIRIEQELAQVQSQLEEAAGDAARLHRRVDTQVLDVDVSTPAADRASSPVSDALGGFGRDFAQAAGAVITFVAYAIPWLVVLVPALGLLRWLWTRRRRPKG